jgi:SAM-dependent methyltransferase
VTTTTNLKRLVKPLARAIYYRLFRFQVRLRCYWADHFESRIDADIPLPPAMLRFRVTESASAKDFVTIGRGCARLIEEQIISSGIDLRCPPPRVLDFGCGCGRTITWFIRNYANVEFRGVDVDAEAIQWCREQFPNGQFTTNRPLPPLHYPDQYFDVVYCLSVFTHLDEDMQDAWLRELRRILKPGRLLILTVHGRNATRHVTPEDLKTLNTVGFLHKKSRKLAGIVPEWYHTTWHSRDYIVNRVSRWFQIASYCEIPDGLQDVLVCRAS